MHCSIIFGEQRPDINLYFKALDVHEKGTAPTITTLRARLQHLEELDKMEVDDGPADAEMKDEEKDVSLEKPTLKKGVSIKPESKEPQMDLENWTDIRLDRWIIDWSLRNGLHDTAALIAKERNLEVCLIQELNQGVCD